ncbi:MAG: GNAT family N-acetyltransferase [Candidatus Thorarchaeota archaeon]
MWEYKAKDSRKIVVRKAIVSDAKNLHNGFRNVVEEHMWLPTFTPNSHVSDWMNWIERCQHTRETLIVAHIDGEYTGHLSLQPEEWHASQHVAKLGIIVMKIHRNNGIGRSLMLAGEEIALSRGYTKIILSTFADNNVARTLYDSLGYRTIGIRKNHFNMPKGYIDEVLMEKELIDE